MKKLITLLILFVGMVSTVSAATETTVYCAVSTTYTVKIEVKTSNEHKPMYEMTSVFPA